VRTCAAMQRDLFRHLLSLSMRFFTRQRGGELASRLNTDTAVAAAGLETIICTVLTAPLLIGFYAVLVFRTSARPVLGAGAALLLHVAVTRVLRGPIRRFATDQFSAFAELAARFQEAITSIRVVKSFGAERFELKRVGRVLDDVLRVNVKFGVYKHIEEPGRAVVNYVIEAGRRLLGSWGVLPGPGSAPPVFPFLYRRPAGVRPRGAP